ncbi:MAG: hypothetical protein WDW36_000828 [Sanguina aurantia]
MAVERAVQERIEEQQDLFVLLPHVILLSHIFPLLSEKSIVRLGSCSHHLKAPAFADVLWRPKCEARKWGPFSRGVSWLAGFSQRQRQLCSECRQATPYVFTILGPAYRLCERCENQSTKYSLVTACEAAERYGLMPSQLQPLPSIDTCNSRFYLSTHVVAVSEGRHHLDPAPPAKPSTNDSDSEQQAAGSSGSRSAHQQRPAAAAAGADSENSDAEGGGNGNNSDGETTFRLDGDDSDDDGEGGGSRRGGGGGGAAAARKEAEKLARKANKKMAKTAQRDKRSSKTVAPTPGEMYGAAMSAAARGANALAESAPMAASPPSDRGGYSGPGKTGGRDGKQNRHREMQEAKKMAAAGGKGGKRGGRDAKGRDGGRLGEDSTPMPLEGMTLGSSPKQNSSWIIERERLMDKWGAFGISGLVMATD